MDESTTAGRTAFLWKQKPRTEDEFEALMHALDSHLASEGLAPFQRPLHVPRLLWDAFGWEGNIFPPKELADLPGFDDQVFMAKAHRWYELVYGEKLKGDWSMGFAPFKLGGALWRVRFPVIYGRCRLFLDRNLANRGSSLGSSNSQPATYNILCSVEDLPQGLVNRMGEQELNEFWMFYISTYQVLSWREDHLVGNGLFEEAMHDYAAAVDDLLHRRYAQSRWASAQAIEKTLKAILKLTKVPYSTKGAEGHDLVSLANKLEKTHAISLDQTIVSLAQCSPAVRYREEPSSENQALRANHAVIGVIEMLSRSPQTERLLASMRVGSISEA